MSGNLSDEDSMAGPVVEAPTRRDKNEKRTRFNLKFDTSAYQDSAGLKKSIFKIIIKTSEGGMKPGMFKTVADLLTVNPLWQPYSPVNEKKATAAYHRLMKQIGREIALGRLDPNPEQPSLPKFLQYGLQIFSLASAEKKAEFLTLDDKKAGEEGVEEDEADGTSHLIPSSEGKSEGVDASLPGLSLVPAPVVNKKRKALKLVDTSNLPASSVDTDSSEAATAAVADPTSSGPAAAKKPRAKKAASSTEGGSKVRLSGYLVAKKLCNDESRDKVAEHLVSMGINTIADLLKAVDISSEGMKTFQTKYNIQKPVARALKPIGEAILAAAQGGVEVHIRELMSKLELSEGDTMDIYEFLRSNVE